MSASLTNSMKLVDCGSGPKASRCGVKTRDESLHGHDRCRLLICILLSLVVHGAGFWLTDLRPMHPVIPDRLLVLDIAAPSIKSAPLPAAEKTVQTAPRSPDVASPKPASSPRSAEIASPKAATPTKRRSTTAQPLVKQDPSLQRETPASVLEASRIRPDAAVGQVVSRPGVTVLANESGLDALKHGSEARFMHGIATEEFVEDNYVGQYSMGKLGRVWIEDDRARSGHLILHAEHMGFRRPLFRFNRFIYVYGVNPDSPEPILGSVTFFSDGYHIHQFLWQHNATYAYYPRRG